MAKLKFPIGSFVSPRNYPKYIFYVYNYNARYNRPYQLVSLHEYYYDALTNELEPVTNLATLLNSILIETKSLQMLSKDHRSKLKCIYHLNRDFDLRKNR